MTLTVTHEGHRYEWDASRPVWTSDTGNVIRSTRLTAKLAVLEREFGDTLLSAGLR